jgi:hypothetical protein
MTPARRGATGPGTPPHSRAAHSPAAGSSAAGRRTSRRSGAAPGRRSARDRGVASLEYLGMLPFLLLIALAGIQLGLVAYCGEQAGTAARTAARTAALPPPDGGEDAGARAGRAAVSDWLTADIRYTTDTRTTITAQASVDVPSVLPGVSFFDPVKRSATMPKEDTAP